MVTVYVANASLQRHEFIYRMMGQSRERRLPIPPMHQIRIPEDIPDIATFVEQHEPYGFVSIEQLKGLKLSSQTRLIYRVNQEIPSEAIHSLHNINRGFLDEWGRKLRAESAIASNALVAKALEDQRNESGLDAEVDNFEMIVQEQESKDGFSTDKPINEGFRMGVPEAEGGDNKKRGKRGR